MSSSEEDVKALVRLNKPIGKKPSTDDTSKRFLWTQELHESFVTCVFALGLDVVTPKKLQMHMTKITTYLITGTKSPDDSLFDFQAIKSVLIRFKTPAGTMSQETKRNFLAQLKKMMDDAEHASAVPAKALNPAYHAYPFRLDGVFPNAASVPTLIDFGQEVVAMAQMSSVSNHAQMKRQAEFREHLEHQQQFLAENACQMSPALQPYVPVMRSSVGAATLVSGSRKPKHPAQGDSDDDDHVPHDDLFDWLTLADHAYADGDFLGATPYGAASAFSLDELVDLETLSSVYGNLGVSATSAFPSMPLVSNVSNNLFSSVAAGVGVASASLADSYSSKRLRFASLSSDPFSKVASSTATTITAVAPQNHKWSSQLTQFLLSCVFEIGLDLASPKKVFKRMVADEDLGSHCLEDVCNNREALGAHHVKSHLQRFRANLKHPRESFLNDFKLYWEKNSATFIPAAASLEVVLSDADQKMRIQREMRERIENQSYRQQQVLQNQQIQISGVTSAPSAPMLFSPPTTSARLPSASVHSFVDDDDLALFDWLTPGGE